MSDHFYDKHLRLVSRDMMRNYLRLYFEFGFKVGSSGDYPIEMVAEANDLLMQIEDDDIDDPTLVSIYSKAIESIEKSDNLLAFNRLPVMFLTDETGIPYGESF